MDRMTQATKDGIVVGVDTHRDVHVAVALDRIGGRLGECSVPTTRAGYAELERWAAGLGTVRAFGIEGTGSYGAGLARHLRAAGHMVREVDRPDRSTRRRRGKSDPLDAEAAARSVLAGTATTRPKAADGTVEALRLLVLTKRSADKARTAAMTQLRAVIVTAPAALRETLGDLGTAALLDRCASLRPGDPVDPTSATRHALRALARRIRAFDAELRRRGRADRPADPPAGAGAPGHVRGGTRTPRPPCSSRPVTNPGGCARRRRSRRCAGRARCPPRRASGPAIASTGAATARRTARSTGSCSRASPTMPRPGPTRSGASPRACPSGTSSAASSAMSPASCSPSWWLPMPG